MAFTRNYPSRSACGILLQPQMLHKGVVVRHLGSGWTEFKLQLIQDQNADLSDVIYIISLSKNGG